MELEIHRERTIMENYENIENLDNNDNIEVEVETTYEETESSVNKGLIGLGVAAVAAVAVGGVALAKKLSKSDKVPHPIKKFRENRAKKKTEWRVKDGKIEVIDVEPKKVKTEETK